MDHAIAIGSAGRKLWSRCLRSTSPNALAAAKKACRRSLSSMTPASCGQWWRRSSVQPDRRSGDAALAPGVFVKPGIGGVRVRKDLPQWVSLRPGDPCGIKAGRAMRLQRPHDASNSRRAAETHAGTRSDRDLWTCSVPRDRGRVPLVFPRAGGLVKKVGAGVLSPANDPLRIVGVANAQSLPGGVSATKKVVLSVSSERSRGS